MASLLHKPRDVFTSAKTPSPIPMESGVFRDALIRASLDPVVRSIEKMPVSASVHNLAIVVRDEGRFAYGVDGDTRSVAAQALEDPLRPLMITMRELYREPAISNDRLIWAHKLRRVSNGIRTQILDLLANCGPVTLKELVSTLGLRRRSETSVFSLVCSDLIEIDGLSVKAFGMESIIRCRSTSRFDGKSVVKPVLSGTAPGGRSFPHTIL